MPREVPDFPQGPRLFVEWAQGLAHLLRATREGQGLTYREAGKQIGIPGSTVHKIEHGGDCRLSSAIRVARWLTKLEVENVTSR